MPWRGGAHTPPEGVEGARVSRVQVCGRQVAAAANPGAAGHLRPWPRVMHRRALPRAEPQTCIGRRPSRRCRAPVAPPAISHKQAGSSCGSATCKVRAQPLLDQRSCCQAERVPPKDRHAPPRCCMRLPGTAPRSGARLRAAWARAGAPDGRPGSAPRLCRAARLPRERRQPLPCTDSRACLPSIPPPQPGHQLRSTCWHRPLCACSLWPSSSRGVGARLAHPRRAARARTWRARAPATASRARQTRSRPPARERAACSAAAAERRALPGTSQCAPPLLALKSVRVCRNRGV